MATSNTIKQTFLCIRQFARRPDGKMVNRMIAAKVGDFLRAIRRNDTKQIEHLGKLIRTALIRERHRK